MKDSPEGSRIHLFAAIMAFMMTVLTLLRSLMSSVSNKLPDRSGKGYPGSFLPAELDQQPKEECRPPSPSPGYTEADLLSSMLKKLAELEGKVDILQSKPCEMPSEKEELLHAAVCRVDALEAELIATKKVQFLVPFFVSIDCINQSMVSHSRRDRL